MKINGKKLIGHAAVINTLILLTAAQTSRKSFNKEPAEQGRTLGLLQPLLGLSLSSIARPFIGYDTPIVAAAAYRPPSRPSGAGQSDPYFSNYGYGNYAGYAPNYYNGYNFYGGYPFYRPPFGGYTQPFFSGYRPQVYPGNYGGYPQHNGYTGQRPRPIAQRPIIGQSSSTYPAGATTSPTAAKPIANTAQASQIANLLGQLLGQQLRPLLGTAAASTAHDELYSESNGVEDKRYRGRYQHR